jgi:hypothetical protein
MVPFLSFVGYALGTAPTNQSGQPTEYDFSESIFMFFMILQLCFCQLHKPNQPRSYKTSGKSRTVLEL